MPANLTAEAQAKWNAALSAKKPEEKLRAFEEFLSSIPKHKGNEKLQAQVKSKIASLRAELEERRQRRVGSGATLPELVEKQGAAQIVILGPTNSGKSSFLAALTSARPLIAPYPFATQVPTPGMFEFEDLQFQLVECPAPLPDPGGRLEIRVQNQELVRNADGLLLLVDLTANPVPELEGLLAALDKLKILVRRTDSSVELVRRREGGSVQLAIMGELTGCTQGDVRKLLASYGVKSGTLRVYGKVTLDEVEDAVLENVAIYKPTLVLGNKCDLPYASNNYPELQSYLEGKIPVVRVSSFTRTNLDVLGRKIFESLDIIRVYTKDPNESIASSEPFILKKGGTTGELAKQIHSALFDSYRYARVWGRSSKFPGERVGPAHQLMDRDIVEIHD